MTKIYIEKHRSVPAARVLWFKRLERFLSFLGLALSASSRARAAALYAALYTPQESADILAEERGVQS